MTLPGVTALQRRATFAGDEEGTALQPLAQPAAR